MGFMNTSDRVRDDSVDRRDRFMNIYPIVISSCLHLAPAPVQQLHQS